MIRLVAIENWFEPTKRTEYLDQWREGLTVEDVLPRALHDAPSLVVFRNGARVKNTGEELRDGDMLMAGQVPGYGTEAGVAFLFYAQVVLVLLAIAGAVAALVAVGKLKKGQERAEGSNSPTYDFGGITNNRNEGEPIPALYGEHRLGGTIVNEFVEAGGPTLNSSYFVQLALSEGPIHSIGGVGSDTTSGLGNFLSADKGTLPASIEINGNTVANYPNVKAWVRLGTDSQDEVDLFDQQVQIVNVNLPLSAPDAELTIDTLAALNANLILSEPYGPFTVPGAAADDVVWDDFGLATDLTDDTYDAFRVRIQFPQGLGWFNNTSGALSTHLCAFALRYQELDSGGVPITTGGDVGDGWIRMPLQEPVVGKTTSPFSVDYKVQTFDPQNWTQPTLGSAISTDTVNRFSWGEIAPADQSFEDWAVAGDPINEISVECWCKCAIPEDDAQWTIGTTPGSGTIREMSFFSLADGDLYPGQLVSPSRGFWFGLSRQRFDVANGFTEDYVVPYVGLFGNSPSAYAQIFEGFDAVGSHGKGRPTGQYAPNVWRHYAFTYKANVGNGNDRARLYVDGILSWELVAPINLVTPGEGSYVDGSSFGGAGAPGNLVSHARLFYEWSNGTYGATEFDELTVRDAEMTPGEVSERFSDGFGSYIEASGQSARDSGIRMGYHGDDAAPTTEFLNFAATNGGTDENKITSNNYQNSAGTLASSTSGKVTIPEPSNIRKRSRWRVEALRAVRDSVFDGVFDDAELIEVQAIKDRSFSFPNVATLSLSVEANEDLAGSRPTITVISKGRKLPVWDGQSAILPNFISTYSANPAWVVVDIATNKRFGAGRYFEIGGPMELSQIDVIAFQAMADYCDELVWDNRPTIIGDSSSGAGARWWNASYDSSDAFNPRFDNRGRIALSFGTLQPPTTWKPGDRLAWTGASTAGGPYIDHNEPDADGGGDKHSGLEVDSIFLGGAGTNWQVWLYWDKLDANDPNFRGTSSADEGEPWNDGFAITSAIGADALDGAVLEKRRRRHEYNGVFDTETNVWDAIQEVCTVARCTPLREGKKLSVRIDNPRSPVTVINHATIKEGTFEWQYVDTGDRANFLYIEFFDKDLNYERSIDLVDDDIANDGSLSFTDIRRDTTFFRGITDRAQAAREAKYVINANRLLKRQGLFETGPDSLHLIPGDVVALSYDLLPWGRGGRIYADGTGATKVPIDREITLQAATTYRIDVRDPLTGQFETGTISTTSGTYSAGTELTVSGAFSFVPSKGAPYTVYTDDQRALVQIAAVEIAEDLALRFSWIDYDEDVYDDDPGLLEAVTIAGVSNAAANPLPPDVTGIRIDEAQNQSADGTNAFVLQASWTYPDESIKFLRGFAIWHAIGADYAAGWERVAEVGPRMRGYEVPVVSPQEGQVHRVCIQPIGVLGGAKPPGSISYASTSWRGFPALPPAPTNLTVGSDGQFASYIVDVDSKQGRALSHEIRRGGWILGQPVVELLHGQSRFDQSSDYAGQTNAGTYGDFGPDYVVRAISESGMPSKAYREQINVASLATNDLRQWDLAEQAWDEYGTGFSGTGTTLTNMVVSTDLEGRPYLEFTGSNLTGAYEAARGTLSGVPLDRNCFVEAFVEAEQDHPTPPDEWLPINRKEMLGWSFEGPTYIRDGDLGNCTLTIEADPQRDGAFQSRYDEIKPGLHTFSRAQFRLFVTRPSADYNVRIYRFHTRVRRAIRFEGKVAAGNVPQGGGLGGDGGLI